MKIDGLSFASLFMQTFFKTHLVSFIQQYQATPPRLSTFSYTLPLYFRGGERQKSNHPESKLNNMGDEEPSQGLK